MILAALLLALPDAPQGAAPGEPRMTPVRIDPAPGHLALADLDGDGIREWLRVNQENILLLEWGGGLPSRELRAVIPGQASLWTVADPFREGRDAFLALVDGRELWRLELREGEGGEALGWSGPLLEDLGDPGRLPRGARRADFLRDLDGDGWTDLVVPLADRMRLFFGGPEGFSEGRDLDVAAELEMDTGSPRSGLLRRVTRRLRVPRLNMRDLSGDGRPDLLITEEGRIIRQYIAGPEGLPLEPTTTVDLRRFEELLGAFRIDAGNVAGLSRYNVAEEWSDLDRDGALDLIVLVGGTVVVYMGGEQGIDLRRVRDQYPVAGNVLYALATPIDNDPYPDLVIIKVQDVSLAKLLTMFVTSSSLEVDVLAFRGRGNGRFEKRPMPLSRKLEVDIPSVRELLSTRDQGDSLRRTVVRLADFDGDGRWTDLAVLDEFGELRGYAGVVRDPSVLDGHTQRFIRQLLTARGSLDLNIRTATEWLLGRASLAISLTHGRKPLFRVPAPEGWSAPHAMTALDLDGDGRHEVLVLRREIYEDPAEGRNRKRLLGYMLDPEP